MNDHYEPGSDSDLDSPNLSRREIGCVIGLVVVVALVALWGLGFVPWWAPLSVFVGLAVTLFVIASRDKT